MDKLSIFYPSPNQITNFYGATGLHSLHSWVTTCNPGMQRIFFFFFPTEKMFYFWMGHNLATNQFATTQYVTTHKTIHVYF